MPVIDGEAAIGQAVQALTSGEIDVNPPYQTEEAPEGEGGQESLDDGVSRDGDDVILERWARLAGLHLLK